MHYFKLRKYERIYTVVILFAIGLLTTIDIIEDLADGYHLRHLGLDIGIAVFSFLAVIILFRQLLLSKQKISLLEKERLILSQLAEELKMRSQTFLEGLSVVIDQSFEVWNLTPSEREIGLFLLKGLSVEEISEIRGSSEKTIRNQTNSIYKKSNLKGRQEFQAYFLEDLLPPANEIHEKDY